MPPWDLSKAHGAGLTVVLAGEAVALGVGLGWVDGPFQLSCWALGSLGGYLKANVPFRRGGQAYLASLWGMGTLTGGFLRLRACSKAGGSGDPREPLSGWTERAVRLGCRDLAWAGGGGQVQRCQPSQELHRHLVSGRGSPRSCAEGLTRAASCSWQRVGRSDTAGGAQVSAGSLLPGAPDLPAWELSAWVNTRRGVRGVSTERQSQGGAGAPPAKPR